jgi:hypothetical protein
MARDIPKQRLNKPLHDPIRPEPPESKAPVNFDLLSDAEKATIRQKAEDRVLANEKLRAENALLEQEMERVTKERNPEAFEEMKDITIDLALYADRIVINGRVYPYGWSGKVPKRVYDTLMEIMGRTFRHEQEINSGSAYNEFYMKERMGKTLSFKTGQATSHTGGPVRF